MTFQVGFWHTGVVGNATNMNKCLVGYGPKTDFPTAEVYVSISSPGNEGMLALATDEPNLYLSKGGSWVLIGFVPPGSLASGDIFYYNGTVFQRLPKGSDGQILHLASGLPEWEASPQAATIVRVGDSTLQNSDDTFRYVTETDWTKKKECLLNADLSVCKIYAAVECSNGEPEEGGEDRTAWAQLYKNGVPFGALGELTLHPQSGAGIYCNEQVAGLVNGDKIQLYIKVDNPVNFTVCVYQLHFFYSDYVTGFGPYVLVAALRLITDPISITNQDPV